MIAIPNMEKPKECDGIGINMHFTDGHMELHILDECELIEMVTCSECKHLEVINGAKIYAHCPMWEIDFYPFEDDTRTNYCSWGERKSNETL